MNSKLSNEIKAEAKNLGFFACGISKAEPVEEHEADRFRKWLASGSNAGMAYMNNYTDMRLDPRLIMEGLKSIVSVALNYAPAKHFGHDSYKIASYALGKDYHDIVKNKLRRLAEKFGFDKYRVFCDSGPVIERYWAVKSGIGWIGRNSQLIIPKAGSMFFLGELFVDIELDYDKPINPRCGSCHACIDACPTKALGHFASSESEEHDKSYNFNAALCLSYQTIENRGEIPQDIADKMGDTIYGCDRCQAACPWNRFAQPNNTPELQPSDMLMAMDKEGWKQLNIEKYRELFKGSAVKRAKYSGLMRNIKAVEENEKREEKDKQGQA